VANAIVSEHLSLHCSTSNLWKGNKSPSSKMNDSCTKEQSSTLSNDEFDNLLKKANVISIPVDDTDDDDASPPTAADNHGAPVTDGKIILDKDAIVIPSLGSLDELPECIDSKQIFVAVSRDGESILYESESMLIDTDTNTNTHSHFYYIQNNDCLTLKSLHISVVFSGVFDGPDYQAAKIDVNLMRLSPEREIHHVGTKMLMSQNSIDSIGVITIDYEMESSVIESGLFELTVTAESKSSYSIRLCATSFARRAELELKRLAAELEEKQRRIEKCNSAHQSLFYHEQLLERKIKVVEDLKEDGRLSIQKCKEKLDRLEDELDHSDGTEDEDTLLLRQIDALSIKHKHFHSLNVQKEDTRRELANKLKDVKLKMKSILKEKETLARETGEIKAMLVAAYSRFNVVFN
jgi:hypothetical protein